MKIESLENKHVKEWNKLKEKKYREKTGLFLIEGEHLLEEALKWGEVCEIISPNLKYKTESIPFYEVNTSIMKKLSMQTTSTDVIAICKKKENSEIKGNICILDCVQDPGNLGTIIRSCVAFGIQTLIVSLDTVDFYNEKVIRSSEGMIFQLSILRQDLNNIIDELHFLGYSVYATSVKEGKCLNKMTYKNKYAIIMGNEGSGVNLELQKKCDEVLTIPMNSSCESLNVGVATSIFLYTFFTKH